MTVEVGNIKIHEIINKNDHYQLCVATLPDSQTTMYSIIHAKYGVPEMSTSILANARKMFDMLTRWETDPEGLESEAGLPDMVGLPPEFLS